MPRYFMQLRDGTEQMLDPEGIDHADIDALRKDVLLAVRDLISEDVKGGLIDLRFRIDAEDRDGLIVYTLGFAEALKIIPDSAAAPSGEDGQQTADEAPTAQR